MILSDEWISGLHYRVSGFKLILIWSFFISQSIIPHVLAETCLHCEFFTPTNALLYTIKY